MHVCTVVEPRRLAWAQALVADVQRHHPGSRCTVLVLAEDRDDVGRVDGADVLIPRDLARLDGLDGLDLARLTLRYDLVELGAALTPCLMRSILACGSDHVVHLDPQVLVLQPLAELVSWCTSDSVVLLPRRVTPVPRDGLRPHEQDVLLTGQYDRAMVGVGADPAGRAMLDWWAARALASSFDAPFDGHHLDQRWLDLVPGSFPHRLVRDPAWICGTVGLAGVSLDRDAAGRLQVAAGPVQLLSVRGYSVQTPHLLEPESPGPARVLLSDQPVLREELDRHRDRLLALDPEVDRDTVRAFVTHDGVRVDAVVRRLVRAEEDRGRRGAPARPGPWDLPLADWLASPDEESQLPRVGRYLAAVYQGRPDLRTTYPEVVRGDTARLLDWAATHGRREYGETLDPVLGARPRETPTSSGLLSRTPAPPRGTRPVDGVEVIGYFTAELGQGESARQFVAGLEQAGIPVATSTYRRLSSRLGVEWEDRAPAEGERASTVLLCVSPEALPDLVSDLGSKALKNRYRIGLWFWELTDFPERLHGSLDLVDEIWVASEFNATTLREVTDKPVVVMPHPAHPPAPSATLVAEVPDDGLPMFLFVFDFLSVLERKNPMALVESFVRAFPEPGAARLVIKSINGGRMQQERERLRYLVSGRDDIVLIERYLSRGELDGLMHHAECYVSLHRSEGFGQTLAESMAIGKPVITTAYSGNLEFTRPENSYLVPSRLVAVPPGNAPYLPPAQWGDPDVGAAVSAMLAVVSDPAEAARRGARARATIAEEFSVAALAKAVRSRWDELLAERRARIASDAPAVERRDDRWRGRRGRPGTPD